MLKKMTMGKKSCKNLYDAIKNALTGSKQRENLIKKSNAIRQKKKNLIPSQLQIELLSGVCID